MAQIEHKRKAAEEEEKNSTKRIKEYGDPQFSFDQDLDTLERALEYLPIDERRVLKSTSKSFHFAASTPDDVTVVFEEETFKDTWRDLMDNVSFVQFDEYGKISKMNRSFDQVTRIVFKSIPVGKKFKTSQNKFNMQFDLTLFKNVTTIRIYDDDNIWGAISGWIDKYIEFLRTIRHIEWMSPKCDFLDNVCFFLKRANARVETMSFKYLQNTGSFPPFPMISVGKVTSIEFPFYDKVDYICLGGMKALKSIKLYLRDWDKWEDVTEKQKRLKPILPTKQLQVLYVVEKTGKLIEITDFITYLPLQ